MLNRALVVKPDHWDPQDPPVNVDPLETVVSLVLMDNKDPREKLADEDVPVLRDPKVVLVIQDELENLVFQEQEVLLESLDQKVDKVSLDQL